MNSQQLIAATTGLPDRDLALLDTLYQHRFLTRPHIQTLFFADHPDPRTGRPVATVTPRMPQRRLQRLRKRGLVARRMLSRPDGSRDPDPYYCLTPDGATLVALSHGLPAGEARKSGVGALTTPLFVRHALAGGDLHCALAQAARAHPGHVCPPGWWQGEQATAHRFAARGRSLLLRPDGYTRYQAGPDIHHLLVEIDLGTMTLHRLQAKIDQYRAYSRSGEWQTRYPVFPKLLLLTTTPRRITTLHLLLGPVPEFVLLTTTHTILRERGPLAAIWRQPDQPQPRPLLTPAS